MLSSQVTLFVEWNFNQSAREQTWSLLQILRSAASTKRSADGFSFLRRRIERNRPQIQTMSPVSGPDPTRPDPARQEQTLYVRKTQTAQQPRVRLTFH